MNSLYIHIPFCEKKCLCCSFVVVVAQERKIDLYSDCLAREAERHEKVEVSTIYIGGGTPSIFNNSQLRKLGAIIKSSFEYDDNIEFTIEANPESIDLEKAGVLSEIGVTRVSLGLQSFNNKYLEFLGRCHDAEKAVDAFDTLRKAGFVNINLDLMFSFPGQTLSEIEADVTALAGLGSEHVSLYSLNVEPKSKFYAQKLQQQETQRQADQYGFVANLMINSGYEQYEISNFAKPGMMSQHNLNYWMGGNYIGLGVGAHSHQDGKRSWNVSRLSEYTKCMQAGLDPLEGAEQLTPAQRLIETLLFGLRMNGGVDIRQLEQRFNCPLPEEKVAKIKEFIKEGFLVNEGARLKTTLRGRLMLDELSSYLI